MQAFQAALAEISSPRLQADDGERAQQSFSTDTDFGFLSVPVSAPAAAVYQHIRVR